MSAPTIVAVAVLTFVNASQIYCPIFVNVILNHVLPLLLPMTAAANSHQLRDAIR
jgi:hypothetical protein